MSICSEFRRRKERCYFLLPPNLNMSLRTLSMASILNYEHILVCRHIFEDSFNSTFCSSHTPILVRKSQFLLLLITGTFPFCTRLNKSWPQFSWDCYCCPWEKQSGHWSEIHARHREQAPMGLMIWCKWGANHFLCCQVSYLYILTYFQFCRKVAQ